MKILIAAMMCALAPLASVAGEPTAMKTSHVSNAALIAAGRQAKLGAIDYGNQHCDSETTVDAWLKSLVGRHARVITWTGGDCQLVNNMHPGIDASAWRWCARAEVTLAHPKARGDVPTVEIYLEKPDHGRPGAAYAFRSLMMTRDDGPDYERFRQDFEAEWRERFPAKGDAGGCSDDEQ
jgi:hypothetical protein